jgi:uncharacterized OB-fold protein
MEERCGNVAGSVQLCLEELVELEQSLAGFSVVDAEPQGVRAAWLCAGCGLEVGPGRSLCEDCEEELMHRQGVAWP